MANIIPDNEMKQQQHIANEHIAQCWLDIVRLRLAPHAAVGATVLFMAKTSVARGTVLFTAHALSPVA
jgi:hypothetical protein